MVPCDAFTNRVEGAKEETPRFVRRFQFRRHQGHEDAVEDDERMRAGILIEGVSQGEIEAIPAELIEVAPLFFLGAAGDVGFDHSAAFPCTLSSLACNELKRRGRQPRSHGGRGLSRLLDWPNCPS